jgi:hypothetical protein
LANGDLCVTVMGSEQEQRYDTLLSASVAVDGTGTMQVYAPGSGCS